MISIIVSSYKEILFNNFTANVQQTIGDVPYEIIQVHNPGLMSICQAYNQGASQAKYHYLVFCHEDILFHTCDWGNLIPKIFDKDPSIGLFGFAGGKYKSYQLNGWAVDSGFTSSYMIGTHYGSSHLSRTYKGVSSSIKLNENKHNLEKFEQNDITNEEVLMLDGMFLCTIRSIYNNIPFDQNTFTGFHCYDLDYSLMVNRNFKVVVNHNILVEHMSPGSFSSEWVAEMKKFNKKWDDVLPYSLYPISNSQKRFLEFDCFERMLRIYKGARLSIKYAFEPIFRLSYINNIGFVNWLMVVSQIILKFIKYPISLLLKKST